LSKRKLNKVRRQKKDVTPTLKTCLIWNNWKVPFSSLTFLHKPAILSFLARQRSWTCSRKSNVLVLLRKRWTLLQYPAAQGLLRDFIRFYMHRDGFNLIRPDLNKGCFNRRTCTLARWIKKKSISQNKTE
jgi:hypothetical protein